MRFFRSERVSKLIREQLAEIIQREIEFRHVLVTVTDVLVDKKLDHAKVMVSVICSQTDPAREQKIKAALAELEKNAGHLQFLLLKKVNIKPMPRIVFALDLGYEHAAEIEKKFEGVEIPAAEDELGAPNASNERGESSEVE